MDRLEVHLEDCKRSGDFKDFDPSAERYIDEQILYFQLCNTHIFGAVSLYSRLPCKNNYLSGHIFIFFLCILL